MASKVIEICEEKVVPIIEQLGYDVIEVEFVKKQDGMNLSFYIDSKNGILIEDCEKVHRLIDPILDEIDVTGDKPYILNVCSPGIDRPIKNIKDYLRNKDKLVNVSLYAPMGGKKTFKGFLKEYNEDNIVIEENGKLISIDKTKIGQIVPEINF